MKRKAFRAALPYTIPICVAFCFWGCPMPAGIRRIVLHPARYGTHYPVPYLAQHRRGYRCPESFSGSEVTILIPTLCADKMSARWRNSL